MVDEAEVDRRIRLALDAAGKWVLCGGPPCQANGLTRFIVLFFIDLSTRRVEVGGVARSANGLWMVQVARNLTDAVDGFFTVTIGTWRDCSLNTEGAEG